MGTRSERMQRVFAAWRVDERRTRARMAVIGGLVLALAGGMLARTSLAQTGPTVLDNNLAVRTVVSGLTTPSTMAFLGPDDFLVVEKNTGRVLRVTGQAAPNVVADLAVNFASERGLLGIALHPAFPANPGVYLFWTCRNAVPLDDDPFFPEQERCSDANMFGPDTDDVLEVPLLGNRVDKFVWNGSTLTFERNLIMLRAFQHDGGRARGNHDGGVIKFGPDGKLYVIVGDVGRRGQLQNLPSGPTPSGQGPTTADDQFGGPEPDDAHLTSVVLRLNDDGSAPADNPFFAVGANRGGQVGANLQKIFAYGVRNSFGMDFDPRSGDLWDQENGDDTFDEINRVEAGSNSGWIQIMGPAERISQYKSIEVSRSGSLQQLRWPPSNIADSPEEALSRLFVLPGSHYSDPEFSWKYAVPPAAIGFLDSAALGPQYEGDLFVGAARPAPVGGYLFHFNLTGNRRQIGVDDPRLEDRVADNLDKFDLTESEELLFGTDFGVVTDIVTGPNGNLFVVSLTATFLPNDGAVYEIYRVRGQKATKRSS